MLFADRFHCTLTVPNGSITKKIACKGKAFVLLEFCQTVPFQWKKSFCIANLNVISTRLVSSCSPSYSPSNEPNCGFLGILLADLAYLSMLSILQLTRTASMAKQGNFRWCSYRCSIWFVWWWVGWWTRWYILAEISAIFATHGFFSLKLYNLAEF